MRPGNQFKIGTKILFDEGSLEVKSITDTGRILTTTGISIDFLMEKYGELPLPPYIEYRKEKEKDYQTTFAKNNGSVAAPTASLHFTEELLGRIKNPKEYVTLHVGLGTFKGIDVADIRDYHIHRETIEIELSLFERITAYKKNGQKTVAVGTTVCRTLESLPSLWGVLDETVKKSLNDETQNYWNMLTQNMNNMNWIHTIMVNHEL